MIDALPDGYAEEQVDAAAGWDEAVAVVQKREARKNAPKVEQPARRVYGLRGG